MVIFVQFLKVHAHRGHWHELVGEEHGGGGHWHELESVVLRRWRSLVRIGIRGQLIMEVNCLRAMYIFAQR